MNNSREDQIVYEVLGHTLRLKRDESLDGIMPSEIVGYVQTEIQAILRKSPNLSESQIAVLVALKIAGDKLAIEKEYRENLSQFKMEASQALRYIEEISPTTRQ
jgi:cell division protein ZapA (FtsZ GTPase activity inhibitor)